MKPNTVSVVAYVDMNPLVVVRTENTRFSAYRVLKQLKSKELLTDKEKNILGGGYIPDEDNFIGEYEIVPHKFTIVGKPWSVGFNLTEQEKKILSMKVNSEILLLPNTYTVEQL